MSVFKDDRSPFYRYDFQINGDRFYGSTKRTTKREAEAVEATKREEKKREQALARAAAMSLRLDDVAERYWQEVGQHHAGARNTERQIAYLIAFLGKDILVTNITGDAVAKLQAWRRGHAHRGKLISAFTVNDTVKQLRKIFVRAKTWGVRFDHEPEWRKHLLAEPEERVRELVGDEHERLRAATRDDYAPLLDLAHATGLRFKELVTLRWDEVDWGARQIRKTGKGGRLVTVPITKTIREILWPLQGHHPEFVFTFVAERTIDWIIKGKPYRFVAGERYPMTVSGVASAWQRLRKRSGVTGFRFHDFRHDFGTKILRATGNLKLTKKAMNHRDIKSTLRYGHVLDDEVADAIESRLSPKNPPNFTARGNLKGQSA